MAWCPFTAFPKCRNIPSIDDKVLKDERVHLGDPECRDCVHRRGHDRLATQIERSVQQNWTTRTSEEGLDQLCKTFVCCRIDRLNASRAINVGHGRQWNGRDDLAGFQHEWRRV